MQHDKAEAVAGVGEALVVFNWDGCPPVCMPTATARDLGLFGRVAPPPFLARLVNEKVQLDEKIAALHAFVQAGSAADSVFAGLPETEQGRLVLQLQVMRQYSEILTHRICARTGVAPKGL